MKIQAIKKRVRHLWEVLNTHRGTVAASKRAYVAEIKSYGNRRYKETWVAALARLEAKLLYEECIDACSLILYDFNFTSDRADYEYRHQILDAFLMYPEALEMLKQGLEQIFDTADFTPTEQQEIRQNGFFKLLEEVAGKGLIVPIPDTNKGCLIGR